MGERLVGNCGRRNGKGKLGVGLIVGGGGDVL